MQRITKQFSHDDPQITKRFWESVDKGSDSGCWEWKGRISRGYAYIWIYGETLYAHKISYAIHYPDFDETREYGRTCSNYLCVNPGHIYDRILYKSCPRCNRLLKREDSFGKRKNGFDRANCKNCEATLAKAWRLRNVEKVKQTNRITGLKRYSGATLEIYDELYTKQNGKCAICGTISPGKSHKNFPVDHNHRTGKIRGLLCHKCNRAIGLFNDDVILMEKAISYLLSDK